LEEKSPVSKNDKNELKEYLTRSKNKGEGYEKIYFIEFGSYDFNDFTFRM